MTTYNCALCRGDGTYRSLKKPLRDKFFAEMGGEDPKRITEVFERIRKAKEDENNLEPPVTCPACNGTGMLSPHIMTGRG